MTRCGYVAIVGRPNVGKSTLLNRLLGCKISITSRKPQTTQQRILGIHTRENVQIIYLDTPGLNRKVAARGALHGVNVIVWVVDAQRTPQDPWILSQLQTISAPIILAINKMDRLRHRSALLAYIETVAHTFHYYAIVPLSAKTGEQVDVLERKIMECLPEAPFCFPPGQLTDRSDEWMASEMIREKLMRILGQELPYVLTVTIVTFTRSPTLIKISAIIWVEKRGQKGIVIGQKGLRLKAIGQQARQDMERYFKQKVFLQLWVKIKSQE